MQGILGGGVGVVGVWECVSVVVGECGCGSAGV